MKSVSPLRRGRAATQLRQKFVRTLRGSSRAGGWPPHKNPDLFLFIPKPREAPDLIIFLIEWIAVFVALPHVFDLWNIVL